MVFKGVSNNVLEQLTHLHWIRIKGQQAIHFHGLTQEETAAKLGVALGTVKSRSHRAHHRLAALLSHLNEATG